MYDENKEAILATSYIFQGYRAALGSFLCINIHESLITYRKHAS